MEKLKEEWMEKWREGEMVGMCRIRRDPGTNVSFYSFFKGKVGISIN